VIFGYPTVVRFSSEIIQKILFFECARIHWYDIYNLNKGENEAEAFEVPQGSAVYRSEFKAKIIERGQNSAVRFSFPELINLSRNFRL
jgi:hypothetical protein